MKIERTIDRESKLKLYVQIYTIIREKIEHAEWPAGTQIPTEDDLCRTYDVSKVTVREAIQELAREGFLRRQQGKGTFVLYSVPHLGLTMRTRLTDVLHGEGVTVRRETFERKILTPSEDIKSILKTEEEIYYILSRKYIDAQPAAVEELFFPTSVLLTVDDSDMLYKSFPDIIEELGIKKISRVVQTCEIDSLKQSHAHHLAMREGLAVLVVSRVYFSSDGTPIAYSRCILGGNKKVQIDFEKIK
jgi:GntR family transcriptional regulator